MLEAKHNNRRAMLAEFSRNALSCRAASATEQFLCLFSAPRALLRSHTYCAGALTSDAP